MMIRTFCPVCMQPYELLIEPRDLDLMKQLVSKEGDFVDCPRLCGGLLNISGTDASATIANDPRLKEKIILNGHQLYKAILGAGLPDEIPKSTEVVDSLLKANSVKATVLEQIADKVLLHEIVLDNGITIHLGADQRGARVVKVTKER